MRLGQVHGAGPVEADHLRQEGALLRLGAVGEDRTDRAVGQALIHVEGHVGRHEDFADRRAHDIGQVLAAVFLGQVEAVPAAFLDRLEGPLEAPGRVDHAILEPAAFGVPRCIQGCEDVAGDLAGFFEDR